MTCKVHKPAAAPSMARHRPGAVCLLVIAAALWTGVLCGKAAQVAGDDLNANTETAVAALQQWYNASGQWDTTGWWNAANCLDAVESAIAANNGTRYLSVITNTYNLNSGGNFLNGYYDDEGWWAEAWIRAYDLVGDARYLNMAKTIFSDMTDGWGAPCGGGIWWDKAHTYKNAIANELFCLVAIGLHQRTPGDGGTGSYYYWATNEWAWFKASGMINAQNLVNDGLTSGCVNNGSTTWTYNQGVILAALADLYKSSGDTNYLNQAVLIANAAIGTLRYSSGVLREPCETTGCGGGDVPQFKGIFARELAYLYDVTHNPAYLGFFLTNAHSVWFQDRNVSNQLGLKWAGPLDAVDAARQSSAIMAISSLAEPATTFLPYARGAGSSNFNHLVGAPAGTLAWACNPATTASTGYMLSGPYLASLAQGSHVAHFRIAVDATNSTSTSLGQLEVRENGSVRSTQSLPWNTFGAAGQSQDFWLPFTNSISGGTLEFRVLWNKIGGTPVFTVSDVTVDGSLNWTAANLAHDVGRLDAWNNWAADPIRDTASGYLTKGANTAQLSDAAYSAGFELKVDNFNWDNATVATISVVNVESNVVVATRNLSRTEFPDTLYHVFSLNFAATAGSHYDFRTMWYYGANAPRLTQRSLVISPAGAAKFVPLTISSGSFNQDIVIEKTSPVTPAGLRTTASMDAGTANTGNGWYEQGFNAAAPATGLPSPGSLLTNAAASDHVYALAGNYAANNAACIDSTHTANLALTAPTNLAALSFLTACGHGPARVDYSINHIDGSVENGTFVSPDWFFNTPAAYTAQGRVDVNSGAFNNVNANNPRLYSKDAALTNTTSPVTNVHLAWSSGNSAGSFAAIFAITGMAPVTAPFNPAITPLSLTQYVGTTATFLVSASGTPPLNYQWKKDGVVIPGATGANLVLSNLLATASGNYSAIASNSAGAVTSGAAVLTVLPLPSLGYDFSAGHLVLSWSNTASLLEATNVLGPWLTNFSASSPYEVIPGSPLKFFRLQIP
jgi:predicted alpha-1,6-mannanase (GH76 family)